MKVLSLFSGIGAFEKALDNLEIPYELVGFSEIDKYAASEIVLDADDFVGFSITEEKENEND